MNWLANQTRETGRTVVFCQGRLHIDFELSTQRVITCSPPSELAGVGRRDCAHKQARLLVFGALDSQIEWARKQFWKYSALCRCYKFGVHLVFSFLFLTAVHLLFYFSCLHFYVCRDIDWISKLAISMGSYGNGACFGRAFGTPDWNQIYCSLFSFLLSALSSLPCMWHAAGGF